MLSEHQLLTKFEQVQLPQLNDYLAKRLAKSSAQPVLAQSMTYSVMAGGKRLRPLLILAVVQSAGLVLDDDVLAVAGSLELLHTYSLIHDDLPAMDNDDLRRGMPTNHVKFGAGVATLAGDGLLTLAFDWLSTTSLSAEKRIQLVRALANAAGPAGMIAGQTDDILGVDQNYDLAELKQLHQRKTGALIHYAVEAGCLLTDMSATQKNALLRFADAFGLAFQIFDDINDVVGDETKLGKHLHVDEAQHKNTYPALLGLDGAYAALKTAITTGRQALDELPSDDWKLLASFFSYFDTDGE